MEQIIKIKSIHSTDPFYVNTPLYLILSFRTSLSIFKLYFTEVQTPPNEVSFVLKYLYFFRVALTYIHAAAAAKSLQSCPTL